MVKKLDVSKIYFQPRKTPRSRVVKQYKASFFDNFKTGTAMSLVLAVLFAVFLHISDSGILALLVFFLADIALVLVCAFFSYRAAETFVNENQSLKLAVTPFLFAYAVIVCSITRIIYVLFVWFAVPFGYVLLPLAVAMVSGFVFAWLVRFVTGSYSLRQLLLGIGVVVVLFVGAALAV